MVPSANMLALLSPGLGGGSLTGCYCLITGLPLPLDWETQEGRAWGPILATLCPRLAQHKVRYSKKSVAE